MQSVASIIQALPAEEEIAPVEVGHLSPKAIVGPKSVIQGIVQPIIQKLASALQSAISVRHVAVLGSRLRDSNAVVTGRSAFNGHPSFGNTVRHFQGAYKNK